MKFSRSYIADVGGALDLITGRDIENKAGVQLPPAYKAIIESFDFREIVPHRNQITLLPEQASMFATFNASFEPHIAVYFMGGWEILSDLEAMTEDPAEWYGNHANTLVPFACTEDGFSVVCFEFAKGQLCGVILAIRNLSHESVYIRLSDSFETFLHLLTDPG